MLYIEYNVSSKCPLDKGLVPSTYHYREKTESLKGVASWRNLTLGVCLLLNDKMRPWLLPFLL